MVLFGEKRKEKSAPPKTEDIEATAREGRPWSEEEIRSYQIVLQSGLFDAEYYLQSYPDARLSGRDALDHYIEYGAYHGYRPNAWFDAAWYETYYPDVRETTFNSLAHYAVLGKRERRYRSEEDLRTRGEEEREISRHYDPETVRKILENSMNYEEMDDLFFVNLLTESLDTERFFEANRDLALSLGGRGRDELRRYLLCGGISEMESGRRELYPGLKMPESIACAVDFTWRVDEDSFFLVGWLDWDEGERSPEAIYLSDGAVGVEIGASLSRFARPDLENILAERYRSAGFYVWIDWRKHGLDIGKYSALIVRRHDGALRRLPLYPSTVEDHRHFSEKVLIPFHIDADFFRNMDGNTGPALQRHWRKYRTNTENEPFEYHAFGETTGEKKVSVIVPLYGRVDFVEYQLALFAGDDFFRDHVELIYVLDDPDRKEETLWLLSGLFPLFRVPCSLVVSPRNYGYAIANNIGARYATTPKLLLLNSDVFPRKAGWLERMIHCYDGLEEAGALGVKLLFEDGAVQHAGMTFKKHPLYEVWLNEHPGKGLPDLETEESVREVPAVTGACLLIDRARYDEVGGLSENYLLGDFEDSDLCLKLIEAGYRNYYMPEIALVHLERQSQNLFFDDTWKNKVTLYNAWQHHRRWEKLIGKLMESRG